LTSPLSFDNTEVFKTFFALFINSADFNSPDVFLSIKFSTNLKVYVLSSLANFANTSNGASIKLITLSLLIVI
jgi:hypothetical protein